MFDFLHARGDEAPILIPAIGLELQVRVPSGSTGGAMAIIETSNAPGFGPPLHRHVETEIFRVLRSRYRFEVDGHSFFAEADDVVTVPGGAARGFVNVAAEPSRQFVVIVPDMDAAAFFSGLAEVMRNGRPDQAALDAFGQAWGVEFLGPPLSAA